MKIGINNFGLESIKIGINNFVLRQTPESEFSHFTGTWEELRQRVQRNFDAGRVKPGYKDGVLLVELEPGVPEHPGCFYTNIVLLKDGDKLEGEYKPRKEGEEPRKSMRVVGGKKMPAESVFAVIYRADVLAEDNEVAVGDWDIISLNASPFPADVEVPMSVGTLIANHFHFSGGTVTGMTPEEFEKALKKSAEFWKDKAMAGGK